MFFLPRSWLSGLRRRHAGVCAGLITGTDFLASSTVYVSGAYIRGGIGASPEDFLWIITLYAAAGTAAILVLERLSRVLPFRTLIRLGLGLFILGSGVAACSQSFNQLMAARVLQGLGGGPLMTAARVMLQMSVPAERRGPQLRGFITGIFLSTALAPWAATALVQWQDWRAVFALQGAYGAAMWLLAGFALPKEAHLPRSLGHFDWMSALAFSLGTLILLHTLQDMRYQWLDRGMVLSLLLALGLFAHLAWHLHRHPDPWFNLGRIASRRYLTGVVFYGLYYLVTGALSYLTPLYLEGGEGYDVGTAGRVLTLTGLATALLLPLYFRLVPYLGDRRRVIALGFALVGGTLAWMAHNVTGSTPYQAQIWPFLLKGLFPILVVIQVAGLTFREFKHLDFAHAYALKNVLRQLSIAVGAGMGNLYWQDVSAQARTRLVERINAWNPELGPAPDPQWLARLSGEIDRQAALLSAQQVFYALALVALLGMVAILSQKNLR